jgi:hypothetical protein
MKRLLGGAALAAIFACPAFAQIAGTFSATLSGFAPTPAYSQLTVGPSSARVALPSGTVVVVYNTGSAAAYVTLGNSSVTATTSGDVIQPSSWMAFTVGANTYLAAIETAGATTLNLSGGSGLPTGAGGGGSVPTGSAGSPNAAVLSVQGVSGGTGVPVTGTFWQSTQPVSLASLPALATGSNTIGGVTQSGTWNINNVSGTVSLPTGAATSANQSTEITDLATVGTNTTRTTAGTSAANALPVQGVTGGVAVPVSGTFWQATQPVSLAGLPALASGSNTIGAVTQASGPWTVNWTQLAGTALGAPSNYGTSPGAIEVQGVNAFVTNTPAVTESGTWTVQPGNTANTTAWLVTGTGGTFPATESGAWNITNISGTVSLPTGAATSANQPTNAAQGSTTSGQTGALHMGAVVSSAPTWTNGQTEPLTLDTSGNLRVNVVAGGGAGGTGSSFGATFPSTGAAAGAEYLSSAPSLTTGQMVALQTDVNGNLKTAAQTSVPEGTTADTAYAGSGNATIIAALKGLYNVMTGAIPAGGNNIGYMPPSPGAAALSTAQVSVGTSPTPIVSARTGAPGTGRVSVTIVNTTTTPIYLGGSGVTTTTGELLPGIVGASITLNTTAAVYGIAGSTATVTEAETY